MNEAAGSATTLQDKIKHLVDFVDRYIKDSYPARPLTVTDIIKKKRVTAPSTPPCSLHWLVLQVYPLERFMD